MESDLPVPWEFPSFDFNSTGFALMGTVAAIPYVNREVRIEQVVLDRVPLEGVPLMGTYAAAAHYMPGDVVHYNGHQHMVLTHMDVAQLDPTLLAMLLDRPEMKMV